MRGCISFVCYMLASILVCTLTAEAQKIRGTPGVDYPNYHTLPKTFFKCSDQKYIPGFYADVETDCQVFHFCYNNRYESFLCPTGTTFNQPILACDSWFNSNCSLAPMFYVVNAGPEIENASKNIPILMKLKNLAQGTSTVESVSGVSEENSVSEESSPEHENQSKDSAENIKSDGVTENIPERNIGNEPEVGFEFTKADNLNADKSNFEEFSNSNKEQNAGHLEESEEVHPLPDLRDTNFVLSEEEFNPEMNADFVYDPLPEVYNMRSYDTSDTEWHESELPNQYQGFYNFVSNNLNDQMMQNEKSGEINQYENFYEYRSNDQQMQDDLYKDVAPEYLEEGPGNVEIFDYENARDIDEMEFSKRYSRNLPKRYRRRPAYVVIDDESNFGYTGYDQNLYDVELTETPLAETISLDNLIELNTQLPIEFEDYEDREISDKSRMEISDVEDTFSADTESNMTFKSLSASEMDDSEFLDRSEDEMLDIESKSFFDNYDEETSEDASTENEEQSAYSKEDLHELKYQPEFSDDSTEFIENYSDVSALSSDSDISPETEEGDSFIVIPDEDSDSVYDSLPEESMDSENPMNQNWGYSVDESLFNENTGETEYTYNDVDESAQKMDKFGNVRYIYENINDQTDDSKESRYVYEDESIGDREMGGLDRDYTYSNPSEIYPQVQGYFIDPETPRFIPQSYEYVSRPESLNYRYVLPDGSYGMAGDGTNEYLDTPYDFGGVISAENYNIPENAYPYGISDETYGYMQQGGYSYSSESGYPYESVYGDQYFEDTSELPVFENVENDVTEMSASEVEYDQSYSEESSSLNEFSENSIDEETEVNFPVQEDGTVGNLPEGRNLNVDSEGVDYGSINGEQIEETYYVFDFDENPEEMTESTDNHSVGTDSNTFEESNYEDDYFNVDLGMESPGTNATLHELSNEGDSEDGESSKVTSDEVTSTFNDESGNDSEHMKGAKGNAIGSDKESNLPLEAWLSQTFPDDESGEKPAKSPRSDFIPPAETQFLNTMAFQNTMGFSPYGVNVGNQFGMMDSTNKIPLSRVGNKISDRTEKPNSPQISRLSSLQEKIRSMKRGKFGMFKKYINAMKKE